MGKGYGIAGVQVRVLTSVGKLSPLSNMYSSPIAFVGVAPPTRPLNPDSGHLHRQGSCGARQPLQQVRGFRRWWRPLSTWKERCTVSCVLRPSLLDTDRPWEYPCAQQRTFSRCDRLPIWWRWSGSRPLCGLVRRSSFLCHAGMHAGPLSWSMRASSDAPVVVASWCVSSFALLGRGALRSGVYFALVVSICVRPSWASFFICQHPFRQRRSWPSGYHGAQGAQERVFRPHVRLLPWWWRR